ncbi:MAG: DUF5683 domain-containing protein [Cyclobacteriaceae bacterium]|nr:DUF5683 domain-containing protein [Cyclobacteriaceae bacterium]
MVFKRTFLLSVLLSVTLCYGSFGQDNNDSTSAITLQGDSLIISGDQKIEEVIDTLENRPNTAALYSAALPGLGQAYNGQYWKIPVIYGGGLVIGYYINYNNQLYKQYRDGLFALIDGDDRTVPIYPDLDEDDYRRQVDYWRRNRDLLFVTAILVYVLNIVDAHVDAHMQLFTVDDDISLKLEPSFSQTAMQTNLIGLSLKLRFN